MSGTKEVSRMSMLVINFLAIVMYLYEEGHVREFDLKSFLKDGHYIGYARANLSDDASEDEIIEFAIKTYQQNLRLEATGELDDETLSSMTTPRCVLVTEYKSTENNYDYYLAFASASQVISSIANRLSLGTAIRDGACKIYKMVQDYKFPRRKRMNDFMYACIYIACRQQGKPLSVQEMCLGGGITEESSQEFEIVRAKEYIVQQLKVEMDESVEGTMPTTTFHAWWSENPCSDFKKRYPSYNIKREKKLFSHFRTAPLPSSLYHVHLAVSLSNIPIPTPPPACDGHYTVGCLCFNLGMTKDQLQAVQETVENAGDLNNIRGKPLSVGAAIIFMITQLSKLNKSLRDISIAAVVGEDSIKSAYGDVYPHAANIIPKWYAKEVDLKNLSSPVQDQD